MKNSKDKNTQTQTEELVLVNEITREFKGTPEQMEQLADLFEEMQNAEADFKARVARKSEEGKVKGALKTAGQFVMKHKVKFAIGGLATGAVVGGVKVFQMKHAEKVLEVGVESVQQVIEQSTEGIVETVVEAVADVATDVVL